MLSPVSSISLSSLSLLLSVGVLSVTAGLRLGHRVPVNVDRSSTCGAAALPMFADLFRMRSDTTRAHTQPRSDWHIGSALLLFCCEMSIFIGSVETLWVNINQQHLRGKKRSASGVFSLFIYSPMAPSLPVLAGNAMFYYSLGMREVLNMDREGFCDLVLQLKLWFLPVYKQQVVFHRWSNWLVINVLSVDPKWAILWMCFASPLGFLVLHIKAVHVLMFFSASKVFSSCY